MIYWVNGIHRKRKKCHIDFVHAVEMLNTILSRYTAHGMPWPMPMPMPMRMPMTWNCHMTKKQSFWKWVSCGQTKIMRNYVLSSPIPLALKSLQPKTACVTESTFARWQCCAFNVTFSAQISLQLVGIPLFKFNIWYLIHQEKVEWKGDRNQCATANICNFTLAK